MNVKILLKKSQFLLSFLFLMLALSCTKSFEVKAATAQNEAELISAINAASGATTIEIQNNFDIGGSGAPINIGAKDITITSNSGINTLKRAPGFGDDMFMVPSNGNLTLKNITLDGNKLVVPTCQHSIISNNGGNVNLQANATLQNNVSYTGGAVWNNAGLLYMTSGKIINNEATYGGGVWNGSGTLTATGGSITNNTAYNNGSGVYNTSTSVNFNVSGNVIIDDVYLDSSTMTLLGALGPQARIIIQSVANPGSGPVVANGGGGYTVQDSDSYRFIYKPGGAYYFAANYTGGHNNIFLAAGDKFSVSNQAQLSEAIERTPNNSTTRTITATANFLISGSTVVIPANKDIILTSDSTLRTITRASGFTGGMFQVSQYGNFVLTNITMDGNNAVDSSGAIIYNSGTFTLQTNATLQNNNRINGGSDGGGVSNYGTFTMNGGTISGNKVSASVGVIGVGGGLYNYGTFTMNAGTISGNKASFGGGVYNNGTFIINAGTISGNEADYGGGVRISTGTFTMNGGIISENTAEGNGGGVSISNGTFTMNGGIISENTAFLGGGIGLIYLNTVTVEAGAMFSGNTAFTARWMTDPADIAIHNTHIFTTQFSDPPAGQPPFAYAYNNYDIEYTK